MFDERYTCHLRGLEYDKAKEQHKANIVKFIEKFQDNGGLEYFKKSDKSYWFAKMLNEVFPGGEMQYDENRCVFAYRDAFYQFYDIRGEFNPSTYPDNCFYNYDDYYGWEPGMTCRVNRDFVYQNQNLNCSCCPDEKCKKRKADCVKWVK